MRKPYWVKRLKCWYVKIDGQSETRLDPDRAIAHALWHRLVAAGCPSGQNATVLGIATTWMTEHEGTIATGSWQRIQRHLGYFARDHKDTLVRELTRANFVAWLKAPKLGRKRKDGTRSPDIQWNSTTQRDVASSVRRVIRWAFESGRISTNPLSGLRLESAETRTATVSMDQHRQLVCDAMGAPYDRSFALVLIAMRCGARPKQVREVTASHVIGATWVFQQHKTKHKTGRPLVVFLPPCLQTLTRILMERHPTGHLFRGNTTGAAWTKDGIVRRMQRMRDRLKLPDEITLYAYRHTFATESLLAGVPIAEVAALLGHTDTRMVSRVYGHLDKHVDHLLTAAARASQYRNKREEDQGKVG